MQTCANHVELETGCEMTTSIYSQTPASIQPRTSPPKFCKHWESSKKSIFALAGIRSESDTPVLVQLRVPFLSAPGQKRKRRHIVLRRIQRNSSQLNERQTVLGKKS